MCSGQKKEEYDIISYWSQATELYWCRIEENFVITANIVS